MILLFYLQFLLWNNILIYLSFFLNPLSFSAFHVFGSKGKLGVELAIIGFLLGTCIAFFVVMGDLGPAIISSMFGLHRSDTLRTSVLICE